MNDAKPRRATSRRDVVRRRRRERQIVVFGVSVIALGALAVTAAAIYRGDAPGLFDQAINSPASDYETDVTLVCPPVDTVPLPANEVVVRVNNATNISGLAGTTSRTLQGRGFVTVGTANWSRDFEGSVAVHFGSEGVREAYTVARHFTTVDYVLDTREGPTVDVVLGDEFAETPRLRELLEPELDPELRLAAPGECLPVTLVVAEPAPRVLPNNPLADAEGDSGEETEDEVDEERETDPDELTD